MLKNSTPTLTLDYTKPPKQLVIDIINKDNGTSIKADQLLFDYPVLTPGKYNSLLKATAVKGKGLRGSTNIKYNRIDIDEIPAGRPRLFRVEGERSIAELIPAIDAAYNLRLTPDDYLDSPIAPFNTIPSTSIPLEVIANPKSLIFINKLNLTLERPGVLLSDAITNIFLSGLNYIAPDPLPQLG